MGCEWIAWCALNSSEQAAWVQAVGGIAAVLAAFAIPLALYQSDRRGRRESDKRALSWFLIRVLPVLLNASRVVQNFIEKNSPIEPDEHGNFFIPAPDDTDDDIGTAFNRLVSLMETSPQQLLHFEELFVRLVLDIAAFNEAIQQNGDQQMRGLHHAWQRDLPDFLEMCRGLEVRLGRLIHLINVELKIKD